MLAWVIDRTVSNKFEHLLMAMEGFSEEIRLVEAKLQCGKLRLV
jgi:hypothetical protein